MNWIYTGLLHVKFIQGHFFMNLMMRSSLHHGLVLIPSYEVSKALLYVFMFCKRFRVSHSNAYGNVFHVSHSCFLTFLYIGRGGFVNCVRKNFLLIMSLD